MPDRRRRGQKQPGPGPKAARPGGAAAARGRRKKSWWSGPLPWLLIVGGLVALGAVGAIVYAASAPPRTTAKATPPPTATPAADATASPGSPDQVGETQPIQDATHIQPPQKASYQTDPPSSGPHYSIPGQAPVNWGYYDRTIAPEYYVHNLEHGGVVLLYNCSTDCTADQASIKDWVSKVPKDPQFGEVKLVAVKYVGPGHRFAMVSWGWRMFMDTWDPAQAQRFYVTHVDHGPEAIP